MAILPHTSLSPWALIILLGRWAFSSSRMGGMSKEPHRRACADLLDSLFRQCSMSIGEQRLAVDLVASFAIKYPRPQVSATPVYLTIMAGGMVDLQSFFSQVRIASAGLRNGWWSHKEMAKLEASMPAVASLEGLLSATSSKSPLLPLHQQLTSEAGDMVQKAWVDGFFGRPSKFRVEKKTMDECVMDPDSSDHRLVSYLMSCRNVASSELFFSCCTDKSQVRRRGAWERLAVHHLRGAEEKYRSLCPAAGTPSVGGGAGDPLSGIRFTARVIQNGVWIASRYVFLRDVWRFSIT